MKHYGIAQWVDFARALAPEGDQAAMQKHLAGGCSECLQIVDFCDRLAVVCRGMVDREVPESAVRLAWAIFPVAPAVLPPVSVQASPRPKRVVRIPVELIFDSLLTPSPGGLRTTWQVGWQALYRAGDCSVDLRVEPDLGSSRAAVIGQISNHVAPEVEMSDIPVCLKQGKLVLAEARSNRFGEFQMEYEQQGRIQLCIHLEEGAKCIQVPIKKLATDKRSVTRQVNVAAPPGPARPGSLSN
jgi:hypothetical protein